MRVVRRLRGMLVGLLGALVPLVLMLLATGAQAHEPFEITTNVRLYADRTQFEVLIADSTAATLCLPGVTKLDPTQFSLHRALLRHCALGLFKVGDRRLDLPVTQVELTLNPENDLMVALRYPAIEGPTLSVAAVHLARLVDPTFGASLTVTGDKVFLGQKLLRADDDTLVLRLPAAGAASAASAGAGVAAAGPVGAASGPAAFVRLGVEHILSGYDHLLFLAGLLLVCRRWRSALLIITAFTLAHSITLALAGLGVLILPSRLVEAAIAATILFVGIDNLLRGRDGKEPGARYLLTFAFGLLHGLGFASALAGIGLPGGMQSVVPLLSFNVGVELGQLAVAALALPLLFWLRRYPWFTRRAVPLLSVGVAAAGAWWLLQRTVLS